jgi:hypothetical protein
MTNLVVPKLLLVSLSVFVSFLIASPGASEEVVEIVVTSVPGGTGGFVDVPIILENNGLEPSTLDLGFEYDGLKLDFFSIEEGPVVAAADKMITYNEMAEGLNVVITGLNANVIQDGHLMTVTFNILAAAQVGDELTVAGSGLESAADPDSQRLPIVVVPGTISVTQDARTNLLTIVIRGPGQTEPAAGVHEIPEGEAVQIRATADQGSRFAGWEGDLGGRTNPETIVMDEDKVVTAVFSTGIQCPGMKDGQQPADTAGMGALGVILLVCWAGTRVGRGRTRRQ